MSQNNSSTAIAETQSTAQLDQVNTQPSQSGTNEEKLADETTPVVASGEPTTETADAPKDAATTEAAPMSIPAEATAPVAAIVQMNPEDAAKAFYSVKHISLIEVQEREHQASIEQTKAQIRETLLDRSKAPNSYTQNSRKEELILEYVGNFRRQYTLLYPGRKELMLCPKNEFGVQVRQPSLFRSLLRAV
jgi:hypothetical protein